jgi:hypothetical protein
MEGDKFLEKIFGKTPGLELVVAAITGFILPLIIDKDLVEKKWWWAVAIPIVWLGALSLSRAGAVFDDFLFDPRYGSSEARKDPNAPTDRALSRFLFPVTFLVDLSSMAVRLKAERHAAAMRLRCKSAKQPEEAGEDNGLYKTAKQILEGGSEWEDRVKSRLEYSKAARVFISPLIVVVGCCVLRLIAHLRPLIIGESGVFGPVSLLAAFCELCVAYLGLQLSAFLYLYLRIAHMTNMYTLISESNVFYFGVDSEQGGKREMISVGRVVLPKLELKLFKSK